MTRIFSTSATISERLLIKMSVFFSTVLLVTTSVGAQQATPQGRTRQQIDAQLNQLDAESRTIDWLLAQTTKDIWINAYTIVNRGVDATLGPFLGRQKDYSQLVSTAEALDIAIRSGNGTFAVHEAYQAYKEASALVARPLGLLTGTTFNLPSEQELLQKALTDPGKFLLDVREKVNQAKEELNQITSDLEATANAAISFGQATDRHEMLILAKNRVNKQIDNLKKEAFTAPYADQNISEFDPKAGFDPSTLSPAAREGWLRNQKIVANETLHPNEITFDPATLTPAEYEGWLRNQAKMRDETLGSSDVNQRLEELRQEAAQADEDLKTAQAELNRERSSTSTTSDPAGSSQSPWQTPHNYVCRSGPCSLTEWQIENAGNPPGQTAPTQTSGKFYRCANGPCTLDEWLNGQQQTNQPSQPQPASQGTQTQQPVSAPALQGPVNTTQPSGNCALLQNCAQSGQNGPGAQASNRNPAQPVRPPSPPSLPPSGSGENSPPKAPHPAPSPVSPPPPSQTCSKEGICCGPGMIPNPQAIACLHAPPIVNGQPNVCWRDQNGRYIPFCIAAKK